MATRTIITTFTFKRNILKVNRSAHADRAILNAIHHLQKNHYKASVAEVHDGVTGKLYAVITRRLNGKITIVYEDAALRDGILVDSDIE